MASPVSNFFIVQHVGPLSWVIQSEDGNKYKCAIGSSNVCTCRSETLCQHLHFILTRFFRVPPSSSLLSQSGFTDIVIDQLMSSRHSLLHQNLLNKTLPPKPTTTSTLPPRPLTDNDDCSICMYPLIPTTSTSSSAFSLVYCSTGCSNSFHPDCISRWVAHSLSTNSSPKCPLCRHEYHSQSYVYSKNASLSEFSYVKQNTTCSKCQFSIKGPLFKCTTCKHVNLCFSCISSGYHSHHSFNCKPLAFKYWVEAPASRLVKDMVPSVNTNEVLTECGLVLDEYPCCKKSLEVNSYVLSCGHLCCNECFSGIPQDKVDCPSCGLTVVHRPVMKKKNRTVREKNSGLSELRTDDQSVTDGNHVMSPVSMIGKSSRVSSIGPVLKSKVNVRGRGFSRNQQKSKVIGEGGLFIGGQSIIK
ncbi:hypothetical protein GEMRC1_003423 [Eukaryota sp. GEM-RC1]